MGTNVRKTGGRAELDALISRVNALANGVLGNPGIADATANGKLKTANPTPYRVDGVVYTEPATDPEWDLTGETTMTTGQYKAYWLYVNAAGTASIEAGTVATSAAAALAALPTPSTSKSVFGVYVAGPSTNFANALAAQGTIYNGTPSGATGGLDLITQVAP